jgi:hypothetical protein
MKKLLFFLIDFFGTVLAIALSIGLSHFIAIKIIFPSNLNDNLQRWLFFLICGFMIIMFLGIWKYIVAVIKKIS